MAPIEDEAVICPELRYAKPVVVPTVSREGRDVVPVLVWLAKFKMVAFPPQVVRAVFSTRLSFNVDFRFAVVVPERVVAPEA